MSARATSTAAPAVGPEPGGRQLTDTLLRAREAGLVVVLGLLVLGTTLAQSRFLDGQNVRDILLNVAIVALLAVGQTVVVLTRNIDLSIASVMGIVAFAVGVLFDDHGASIPVAFVCGIAMGTAFGLANGVLVSIGRVPSLVVTLGTLYVIRGADFAWAKGRQINAADMPDAFLNIGSASVGGVPVLALVSLAILFVVGAVLRSSRMGRELYAIGSNPEAAHLAGIRVTRRVLGAFVASGALAGLAGVLYAARFGTVDANAATGQELAVVAAVVVGGVAITGGSGSVYGAALGALLLGTISSALVVLKVNPFWNQAINGLLLLAAIALDRLLDLRVSGLLRRRSVRRAR
jgi:ribose/xylose/arabinose/galactoside ABC-type transport system permease subunit